MKAALAVGDSRYSLQGEAFAVGDGGAPTTEIEVILAGDYKTRGLVIDERAIDGMIANHQRAGVDPAVDREHESWSMLQLSPSPAMGWVKSLSKRPATFDPSRMALVAHVEWTDVGAAAVAAKHYRYISAGIDLKAKDRRSGADIGVMLDHVALVKHPFVQGMAPLSLSAHADSHKELNPMKSTLKALGLNDDADDGQALAAVVALTDKIAAKDSEIAALKSAVKVHEDEAKAATAAKLAADLDAKIAAFAVDPSERAALLELAAESPKAFSKLLALRVPRDPSGPKLSAPKSASAGREELQTQAIDAYLAANAGVDYATAIAACAAAQPDLFADEAV